LERATEEELQAGLLDAPGLTNEMQRLCEDGFRGENRPLPVPQDLGAFGVAAVTAMNDGDEGTGIKNQWSGHAAAG